MGEIGQVEISFAIERLQARLGRDVHVAGVVGLHVIGPIVLHGQEALEVAGVVRRQVEATPRFANAIASVARHRPLGYVVGVLELEQVFHVALSQSQPFDIDKTIHIRLAS